MKRFLLLLFLSSLFGWWGAGCGGTLIVGSEQAAVSDAGQPDPTINKTDKVDILFMIDNSSSMGDKQDLLAQAIPDFLSRLLVPRCVLDKNKSQSVARTPAGTCPEGSSEEFPPVTDLHVGVVTSSLGGGGASDICLPNAKIRNEEVATLTKFSRHNDDRGWLINRQRPDEANPPASGIEDLVLDANPANFLAWLPDVPKNKGKPEPKVVRLTDPPTGNPPKNILIEDFKQLVRGAGEFGCGLEAQMESWYRFLVQPDPWDSIEIDTSTAVPSAQLVGVDVTILQQRHDFLRPDSLLAIVVVTDEEDSWSDPMWFQGRGWITRAGNNTYSNDGRLPRGTKICSEPVDPNDVLNTGANSKSCQWCGQGGTQLDPNCAVNNGLYDPKDDDLNVRYTDNMKVRYGMNPQFPISRYTDGLRSVAVPDREGEHLTQDGQLSAIYIGRKNCTNPIFAKNLPTDPNGELCKLERGPRSTALVYLTVIGGVPWQLLTTDPKNPKAQFKSQLTDSDWEKILGKDPQTYQLEGIDPHMVEQITPRGGISCGTSKPNDCDPFHGREWDTTTSKNKLDLQYACTFTLPQPKDCTKVGTLEAATCDCGQGKTGVYSQSPLCEPNPNDNNNPTLQTRGKAYPTIRELRVVRAMGPNGVISSLCPRTLNEHDEDYGYRPAFRILVDRMRNSLL